ncbi:MAG: hypothetical protein IPM56_13105 [Ignavibacteriales bacterium]|nr:MAG: hypothetical protein IPM56_13105 [Ignavibacteriales bacterium]
MREIFRILNRAYQNNDFQTIFEHEFGIYFLMLRSLSRNDLLRELSRLVEINIEGVGSRQLFEHIFCQTIPQETIQDFVQQVFERERAVRRANEDFLYTQLFRLQVFNWGGFYQNAVEQTIVNNYVKKIQDYNQLSNAIDNDLNPRLRGYILCSWYNHWSSILIEDMFKDHPDITPAVGLVKKVDFFWHNFPFDLKVTYFPDGYMKLRRQELGLRPEFTELKRFARGNNIPFDRNVPDSEQFQEILTRITEHPSEAARNFLEEFRNTRREIINNVIQDPRELITWFYENQGTRRFDSANRFFVVLIDMQNLEDSWRLKRNREILSEGINNYLNQNREVDFNDFRLNFDWDGQEYHTHATTLFLLRE